MQTEAHSSCLLLALCHYKPKTFCHSCCPAFTRSLLTTVGVDAAVVQESNPEVVQDSRFMEEAKSCKIIFPLQDVGVPQRWEIRGGHHWVMDLLPMEREVRSSCCGEFKVVFFY